MPVLTLSCTVCRQAIKQMYVLVLGLDVLGNPFGVIRGLAEGLEDLFYEPYQVSVTGIHSTITLGETIHCYSSNVYM